MAEAKPFYYEEISYGKRVWVCHDCHERFTQEDLKAGASLSTYAGTPPSPKNLMIDETGHLVHTACWQARTKQEEETVG